MPARPGRKISLLPAFAPYALIAAIISVIFVWDYTVNQSGATGPFAILWNSFTTRRTDFQVVRSSMLLVMVLFTWLIGGIVAIAEVRADGQGRLPLLGSALLYSGTVLVTFLGYGLIHAASIELVGLQGLEVFHRMATHVVVFDGVLLLLMLALAAILALARPEPWPQRFASRTIISAGAGIVLTGLALFLIVTVNIRSVQADTYYKQGLGYEAAGQWEGSVILYREAARLQHRKTTTTCSSAVRCCSSRISSSLARPCCPPTCPPCQPATFSTWWSGAFSQAAGRTSCAPAMPC